LTRRSISGGKMRFDYDRVCLASYSPFLYRDVNFEIFADRWVHKFNSNGLEAACEWKYSNTSCYYPSRVLWV